MEGKYFITKDQLDEINHYKRMFENFKLQWDLLLENYGKEKLHMET